MVEALSIIAYFLKNFNIRYGDKYLKDSLRGHKINFIANPKDTGHYREGKQGTVKKLQDEAILR